MSPATPTSSSTGCSTTAACRRAKDGGGFRYQPGMCGRMDIPIVLPHSFRNPEAESLMHRRLMDELLFAEAGVQVLEHDLMPVDACVLLFYVSTKRCLESDPTFTLSNFSIPCRRFDFQAQSRCTFRCGGMEGNQAWGGRSAS